jgi:hypothetical protein
MFNGVDWLRVSSFATFANRLNKCHFPISRNFSPIEISSVFDGSGGHFQAQIIV